MFCEACGSAIESGQYFCSHCGKQLMHASFGQPRPGRVQEHIRLVAILWLAFSALPADETPRPIKVLFLGDNGHHRPAERFRQLQPVLAKRGIDMTYTDRVESLELAAAELATNSIRYGGGAGAVAMWAEDGAAVLEFTDAGTVDEPLTGRLLPSTEDVGGRGLYLVNQLCDLVQLRSSPAGTTVRLTTWL